MNIKKKLRMCKSGNHELVEIYNKKGQELDNVVRWCNVCGAVVVDLEVDGKLWEPGGYLSMMAPKINDLVQEVIL